MTAKIKEDYDLNRLVSEWGFKKSQEDFYTFEYDDTYTVGVIEQYRTPFLAERCSSIPQIIIDMALAGVFEKGDRNERE